MLCLLVALGAVVSEVSAQRIFFRAQVNYRPSTRTTSGYTTTWLDYYAALYFNPAVQGELYRADINEQPLDSGYDVGNADLEDAEVFLFSTNYLEGKTYCTSGNHFVIDRETGISDLIQSTYPCITIPSPPPPSPTPTASPTPTPSPMVQVEEVGFIGDHTIRRWQSLLPGVPSPPNPPEYIDSPDGSTPTWVRGGANNGKNPAAYTKGTNPTLFAKLSITPSQSTDTSGLLRLKKGGNVITNQNTPVTLSGSTVSLSGISINANALESQASVKKGTYNFDWEISLDNGQTWQSIGTSSGHVVYWTYAAPKGLDCTSDSITTCTFVSSQGQVGHPGLYDLALEKAIGELPIIAQTPVAIGKSLAANVDTAFIYDPGPAGGAADTGHPLSMYFRVARAQCSANANLLLGLLRSIGFDAATKYLWGGTPTPPTSENGGKVYVYKYRKDSSPFDQSVTFMVKRPESRERIVPKNPHFAFHAMVKLDNYYYDPSYGNALLTQNGYPYMAVGFKEVVDLTNPADPSFKQGGDTSNFVVKALNLTDFCIPGPGNPCTANTVVTDKVCPHSWQEPASSSPFASFDGDRITDIAVWRPSDGIWYIRNSSDQTISYPQLGQAGDRIAPGDYDGDGIADLAVFRPSNATWYIQQSGSKTLMTVQWGTSIDVPISGDFDGDGKVDIAVYRPDSLGSGWYIRQSSTGSMLAYTFGLWDDKPVSGDFDGDGKTDIAVFRASNRTWHWLRSSDAVYSTTQFGLSGDQPVTGDYDWDQKTDLAVFRPSTGEWHLLRSTEGYLGIQFGANGDIPVQGDYDEDGRTDAAVWTPATGRWRILKSSDSTQMEEYWGSGSTGDIPVPSAFNR